jgi:hypothetical protein
MNLSSARRSSGAFSMRTMAKNWSVNAYSNVVRDTTHHDRGAWMNYSRIALAALGATVAYFVLGGILFGALPSLRKEFMKYPAVYRTQDDMKRVMPMGMISILVAIFVVAVLYAMAYPAGGGVLDGARFGALIGVFAVCGFALHNHMMLNIGIKLTVGQAISYFVQWLGVGIVISLIYAPATVP